MKKNNIFYGTVWSKDELKQFRKMFKKWDGIETEGSQGTREIMWLSKSTENVVNYPTPLKLIESYFSCLTPRVGKQFVSMLKNGYSIDAKLALYHEKKHSYMWHSDDCVYGDKEWKRLISSITYLNDDYDGGETEFEFDTIKPVSGKTLAFPSSFTHPHRGLPVKSGIKQILVMHVWA